MYRQSFVQPLKRLPRRVASNIAPPQRRFLSTAPPHQKSRSWKSSAARWGLAIGGVYFYNTSPVFAEEPSALLHTGADEEDQDLPTLDSVRTPQGSSVLTSTTSSASPRSEHHTSETPNAAANPSDLEAEAHSEGAFNPITGEINWDCPCLGGMAYGPCGEEFRTAFSCFVYSTEEPKGINCVEKFQGMQECFKLHPDIYAGEFEDGDEVPEAEMDEAMREEKRKLDQEVAERRAALGGEGEGKGAPQKRLLDEDYTSAQPVGKTDGPLLSRPETKQQPEPQESQSQPQGAHEDATASLHPSHSSHPTTQAAKAAKEDVKRQTATTREGVFDEELELMPKEWHDQRDAKADSEKGKKTDN